jgi:hypothetical protein
MKGLKLCLFLSVLVACAVSTFAQTPNKVYFSDDFENGVSKWQTSSGTWGLIATDFRSGMNSISASPGQNYALNANSILAIPATHAIDLTGAIHPYLSFWHKFSIAGTGNCCGGTNWDNGYIEVSTNYGVAWTQIDYFHGEITSWTPQEEDLTPYIGEKVLIRFRLWDGGYGNTSWGWFLDDVEVREKGPLTVGVTVSVSPSGGGTVTGKGISCPGTCAETFPTNWNLSGQDWALITTDYESSPASISASPNGNYALYANSTLELAKPVDISKATAPALTYWDKYSIAGTGNCCGGTNWDYGYVEVSQDDGLTWTQLSQTDGTVSSWTQETLDLTPYIKGGPILVRFRLWDGGYGNVGWGWEVDDIEITDLPTDTVYFSDDFESPKSVPDFSDVTLIATPSAGYALPTWTGCNSTDENQCIINRYIDRAVNATFTAAPAPTIGFTVPAQTYGAAPFTVAATSNSAGVFTYKVVSGPAKIVDTTVTLTGAGTVVLQASEAASRNYAAGTKQATFTVNKAVPPITWATPAAITYGTALSGIQLDATSTVAGTFGYSPTSGTVLTTGKQTLSVLFTPTDTTDYATATKTVTLVVNKATPSITWATPAAIPYGTALSSKQLNATSTVAGTFAYTPASGTVLTAGTHTLSVTLTPTDTTDYTTATKTVSLVVNKAATPPITWATPKAITYGTALGSTQLNATSTVAGTFAYTPASGTVLTAGTHTLSVTLTPTDTTDYTTATKTVSLVVNKATLTVTASSPTVTYGAPVPTITPGYSGYKNGDTVSVVTTAPVCSTTYTTTTKVNATPPTTSCSGGKVTSNYSLSYVGGKVTVNKAKPSITWATPKAITYGTALSSTQLNATSTVAGTFAYTPASGTVLTAGTHTLSVTLTPTDTTDYTTATKTVSLVVVNNKVTPSITWATPKAITYGTALSSTQLNATSTVAGTFAYTPTSGTVLTAGTQTLSVLFTPKDTTDYTTATKTVSLVVNKAVLTIAAINQSSVVGSPLPVFTYSLSGFAAGESLSGALTGAPNLTTTATSSSPAGSYPINVAIGTLAATNYRFNLVNGTLTITAAGSTQASVLRSGLEAKSRQTAYYTLNGTIREEGFVK